MDSIYGKTFFGFITVERRQDDKFLYHFMNGLPSIEIFPIEIYFDNKPEHRSLEESSESCWKVFCDADGRPLGCNERNKCNNTTALLQDNYTKVLTSGKVKIFQNDSFLVLALYDNGTAKATCSTIIMPIEIFNRTGFITTKFHDYCPETYKFNSRTSNYLSYVTISSTKQRDSIIYGVLDITLFEKEL